MKLLTVISNGKAVIQGNNLRCFAPRLGDPKRVCNKLLAKKNAVGQVAGNFRCERCHQEIEIKLVIPAEVK